MKFEIWNFQNLAFEITDLKLEIGDLKLEIQI